MPSWRLVQLFPRPVAAVRSVSFAVIRRTERRFARPAHFCFPLAVRTTRITVDGQLLGGDPRGDEQWH